MLLEDGLQAFCSCSFSCIICIIERKAVHRVPKDQHAHIFESACPCCTASLCFDCHLAIETTHHRRHSLVWGPLSGFWCLKCYICFEETLTAVELKVEVFSCRPILPAKNCKNSSQGLAAVRLRSVAFELFNKIFKALVYCWEADFGKRRPAAFKHLSETVLPLHCTGDQPCETAT